MIKLSKRLQKVSDIIEDNTKMIDIGCDHGLLDIYLMQTKKNITIIASDININALNAAKENIEKYNLTNKIKLKLGNGLEVIDKEEIDTIVISGMGSHNIVGILQKSRNKLTNIKNIIIQSNTNIEFLREKIIKLNYYIENEILVKDKDIIYTIIKFKQGKKHYTKREIYFGPILIKENSNLFQEKCNIELNNLKKLMTLIPKNHYHHRFITFLKIRMYK